MGTPSYDLYLDDSGTRFLDNPETPPPTRNDGMDYFALGGLLLKSEDLGLLIESYDKFAKDHGIVYPLHSHKIRTRKEEFGWLKTEPERATRFYQDLSNLLCQMPGYVTACCVHRPDYNARYSKTYGEARWKLSKSAYNIVVERAAKFALRENRKLVVYVEASGKKEDKDIKIYHRDMVSEGMQFNKERSQKYSPLGEGDFRSVLMKNPNFVNKTNRAAQIADLVLYPVVKGRYVPNYPPYQQLMEAGKIIDTALEEGERISMGVKYFCFDTV